MNLATPLALAALCTAFAAAPASAQTTKLQPGLWEYTMNLGGSASGELAAAQDKMAAELAKMPPEQRKMVEGMMAKRGVGGAGGAGGPAGARGATTVKACVTPESIEREDFTSGRADCKQQVASRTASTVVLKLTCDGPPPSTGEMTMTFQSATAYAMNMVSTTTANGKAVQTTMDGSGKWLGADCGGVKPARRPG